MDLLADILNQAGVRRRLLHCHHLPEGAALQFPCDRSIGFHVVTQGQAFVHPLAGDSGALRLKAGEMALMSRGCSHVVSSEPAYAAKAVQPMGWSDPPQGPVEMKENDSALLVSGAYQVWNPPVHPFFHELPDWMIFETIPPVDAEQLGVAIRLLDAEIRHPALGFQSVMHALLDVIFTYVLRRIVAKRGATSGNWSHGIQEPQIRRVVELMHAGYARPWTLTDLAREAGLSRASLAEKFRAVMGSTPGDYLRKVRMQRAMRLLSESSEGLEAVASAVGYRDAFGFSKVFKRTVGMSPRQYRLQDQADRTLTTRI